VSLEKVGVVPGAVSAGGCSTRFLEDHRLSSYSNDLIEFAQFAWKRFPNRNRILFGVSEGGWVAANMANKSMATHIVLLSSGGGTGIERLLLQASNRGGETEVERTKSYYLPINERTDAGSLVYGDQNGDYSVGYLQEGMAFSADDRLRPMKAKFLVAHGGKDEVVPVQLASHLCEKLSALKSDVVYFYEPDGDHGMSTPDRQSSYRFFSAFPAWLAGTPSPFLTATCPFPGKEK
jgi:pimeloyl-ACP methyl ester carboxylesterase